MSARKTHIPDSEVVRQRLKLKKFETTKNFSDKYPQAKEFLAKKNIELGKIREHSAKLLGAGALTTSLLLSPPLNIKELPSPHEIVHVDDLERIGLPVRLPSNVIVETLGKILPDKTRELTRSEEKYLEKLFENTMGIKARATLEGEHLNTTYGLIGAEQHLRRYPGDSLSNHGTGTVLKEGIAPGLGAWGYFAPSQEKLTPDLDETEKWYAVVQTLYLPDWNTRQPYLQKWYKYRKVLIVNTQNGKAVVASIADAGPAAWTGKHFGGSPEVMEYLGGSRYKKGAVVLFFVDDPDNTVALGPVEYNDTITLGKI